MEQLNVGGPLSRWWSHTTTTYSPTTIEFFGSAAVLFIGFWVPSLIFTWMDTLGPKHIPWRKIQAPARQPQYAAVKKGLVNSLQNQLLTSVLHLAYLGMLHFFTSGAKTTIYNVDSALPSPTRMARDIVISIVLQDIIFYHSHRGLHHPKIYRHIHKKHHEFTTPIALAALYAHPVEYFLSNILPVALPPALLGAHVVTFWFMLTWALLLAIIAHCGYELPPIYGWNMEVHDMHHELFVGNFGTIGFCDVLYGTRLTDSKATRVARDRLKEGKAADLQ
jgi:sterol desaturase/sphingolipid hydroxylase (fatty acid hydroxylase superfamily)